MSTVSPVYHMVGQLKMLKAVVHDFDLQVMACRVLGSPEKDRKWRDIEIKVQGIKDRIMEIENEIPNLTEPKQTDNPPDQIPGGGSRLEAKNP